MEIACFVYWICIDWNVYGVNLFNYLPGFIKEYNSMESNVNLTEYALTESCFFVFISS